MRWYNRARATSTFPIGSLIDSCRTGPFRGCHLGYRTGEFTLKQEGGLGSVELTHLSTSYLPFSSHSECEPHRFRGFSNEATQPLSSFRTQIGPQRD